MENDGVIGEPCIKRGQSNHLGVQLMGGKIPTDNRSVLEKNGFAASIAESLLLTLGSEWHRHYLSAQV